MFGGKEKSENQSKSVQSQQPPSPFYAVTPEKRPPQKSRRVCFTYFTCRHGLALGALVGIGNRKGSAVSEW